ncbi:hypothetical protein Tco_0020829 [Tanacetum coccineum]
MLCMAHQDEYGGATTGASGNSNDGGTIADGIGKMEAVGISGVEVVGDDDHDATLLLHLVSIASCGVGDTCLPGISVSESESFEHRKCETIDATDTGGGELSDGSAFDDE